MVLTQNMNFNLVFGFLPVIYQIGHTWSQTNLGISRGIKIFLGTKLKAVLMSHDIIPNTLFIFILSTTLV